MSTTATTDPPLEDMTVPVLIVGGGGAGLAASMLLSTLGIETVLVSALPTTSQLPKAHLLNQRTMEILAEVGVAEAVYAAGTPREHMTHTAFYAGFAGDPRAGRRIAKMESWGAGGLDLDWEQASPRHVANLPQIRLEPILKRRADELAPGRVRFGHEVTACTQDADGVVATVLDRATGQTYTVAAQYLLACDGGRKIGPDLGIEMIGPTQLGSMVSIHLSSDLSAWAEDPDVLIRWTWIPETGQLATLVPMGPDHWGPHSEEWVFHLNYAFADPRSFDDAQVEADMRTALGIGDHPVDIHLITRWELQGVVASELRRDRIFLLGDAAHRHPPTGGLGLASAIQDAHNLAWKVAAVLRGDADPSLLDSYEPERRSSVQANVDNSVDSSLNHLMIGVTLDIVDPDLTPDQRWERLERLWNDDPSGAEYRAAVRRAIATQTNEFRKHNVEVGYTYASSAVISDGTEPVCSSDPIRLYVPSTRPGCPLPHAWIEDAKGQRRSTLDLVLPGRFVLIAGEEGDEWVAAGRQLAASFPLDVTSIGIIGGDWTDAQARWTQVRGISSRGAILVRPDRFVAWRSLEGVQSAHHDATRGDGAAPSETGVAKAEPAELAGAVLAEALATLLGRSHTEATRLGASPLGEAP